MLRVYLLLKNWISRWFCRDTDEIGLYDVLDERFLKTITVEDVNLFSAFGKVSYFKTCKKFIQD